MSRRTVFGFALAALFATLASPAVAQIPEAPAPRQESTGIRLNLGTSIPALGPIGLALDFQVPVIQSPNDHKQLVSSFSIGLFGDDGKDVEVAPMPREAPAGIRITIPPLGILGKDIDFAALNNGVGDKRQLVVFSEGLFGGDGRDVEVAPMPRDKTSGTIEIFVYGSGPAEFPPVYVQEARTSQFVVGVGQPVPAPPQCAFDRCMPPFDSTPLILNERNLTWTYNARPVAQWSSTLTPPAELALYGIWNGSNCNGTQVCNPVGLVPMPQNIVRIIGDIEYQRTRGTGYFPGWDPQLGYSEWVQVYRAAPPMTCPQPAVYGYQHPLASMAVLRCDGHGGWWMETVAVPQPRRACCVVNQQFNFENGLIFEVEGASFERPLPASIPQQACQAPVPPPCCSNGFAPCPPQPAVHPVILRQLNLQQAQQVPQACPHCTMAQKSPLAGTWYRELEGLVIAATFTGDEMKLCVTHIEDGNTLSVTITAEYTITKDGLVHGVVTGFDMDGKRNSKSQAPPLIHEGVAEAMILQQMLVDCPFSFRIKSTSVGMMVSNVRAATPESADMAFALGGMYKFAADGRVPTPRAMKEAACGRCESNRCDGPVLAPPEAVPAIPTPVAPAGYVPGVVPGVYAPEVVPTMPTPTPPGSVQSGMAAPSWEDGSWWVETAPAPQPRQTMACPNKPSQLINFGNWSVDVDVLSQPAAQVPQHVLASPPACCADGPAPCPNQPAVHAIVYRQLSMQQACPMAQKSPLAGTWYRESDGTVIAATFAGDEMKLCLTKCDGANTVCFTLTADYAMTKEGLVHGVVTGIDVDVKTPGKPRCDSPTGEEMAEVMKVLHQLVDCPFSFRVKSTSAGMMVSSLKVGAADSGEVAIALGMYKFAADGKVPTPKPTKTTDAGSSTFGGMTLPSGRYLQHYPQYFAPDPQHPLPRELATQEDPEGVQRRGVEFQSVPTGPIPVQPIGNAQPQAVPAMTPPEVPVLPMPVPTPPGEVKMSKADRDRLKQYYNARSLPVGVEPACPQCPQTKPMTVVQPLNPPVPANVPAGEFSMIADALGQMLVAKQPCPGPTMPPAGAYPSCAPQYFPAPPMVAGCGTSPQMLPPPVAQYSTYPACPGVVQTGMNAWSQGPQPASMPMTAPQASPLIGTWYREVGPRMCVVKIAPDHMTLSFVEAGEMEDGKVATGGIIVTADYHLTRDGTTVVGLITNVDCHMEGDMPADAAKELMEVVADLQKSFEDKPFAMKLRVYGDTLVIGNVRMPEMSGSNGDMQPATMFGGRYKNAGNKPLPKLKPMKAETGPQAAPTSVLPPTTRLPCVPGCGTGVPPAGQVPRELDAPPAYELPPPPPTMTPPPAPPGIAPPVIMSVYSTEPLTVMPQLLYQSETHGWPVQRVEPRNTPGSGTGPYLYSPDDLRKINEEWRRFWFNKQPNHLTPERIHGGIL